jgi:hypothetical protein
MSPWAAYTHFHWQVREEMVAAGQAIVDAHGSTHAPRLLPLFESFLERGAGAANGLDEGQYDLVSDESEGGTECEGDE